MNKCLRAGYKSGHRWYPASFTDCRPVIGRNTLSRDLPSPNYIFYADKVCDVKTQAVNKYDPKLRRSIQVGITAGEVTCQAYVPLGGTPRRAAAKTCGSVPLTQCCGTFDHAFQPR